MRKKLWILGLALLMLLTAACQKQPSVENPTEAPSITDPTVATDPSQPTTQTLPSDLPQSPLTYIPPAQYALAPEGYHPFLYYGAQLYIAGKKIDCSTLQKDHLYLYRTDGSKVTPLADTEISCFDVTSEHIYYVPAGGKEIIRIDYTGQNKLVIFAGEQPITWIDYHGGHAEGRLLLVENGKRAMRYDIASKALTFMMEQYRIDKAYYYEHISEFSTKTELNRSTTIHWVGKRAAHYSLSDYLYFPLTQELASTFRPTLITEDVSSETPTYNPSTDLPVGFDIISYDNSYFYSQPQPWNPQPDHSDFLQGHLYTRDEFTNVCYLIADWKPVAISDSNEYLYYVSEDQHSILRSDYMGLTCSVVYQTPNKITHFNYCLPDTLVVTENENTVLLFHIATGSSEVLLKQYYIYSAHYHTDSSAFTLEEKGPTVLWYGLTSPDDPLDPDSKLNIYTYYLNSKELIKRHWL